MKLQKVISLKMLCSTYRTNSIRGRHLSGGIPGLASHPKHHPRSEGNSSSVEIVAFPLTNSTVLSLLSRASISGLRPKFALTEFGALLTRVGTKYHQSTSLPFPHIYQRSQ